jgi:diguanylate cyclase (GGDEF)-like protein
MVEDTSTVVSNQEPDHRPVAESSHAALVMLHGREMGVSHRLDKTEIVIGRSTDADIQIDDENVSRRHALISVTPDEVTVKDLESTNGTFVNSRRIKQVVLEDGDLLMISSTVLKYVSTSSIENHFFDQMYSMVTSDPLTGIRNHRYFSSRLDEEFNRARRHERPLTLMVYDIDNFKVINDSFGHQAGDQLLARSARLVSRQLRRDDVYARIGGDEFCVLCPETMRKQALQLAQRLRELVHQSRFTFRDWKLDVTISIGIAELAKDMTSPEQLLETADKALYQAKQNGKNSVCA